MLKYFTKLKVWKASNVSYDPHRELALSYGWWIMVKRINGLLVFNDYAYSTSTRAHQRKVRKLLDEMGVTIDLFIQAPKGLQDLDSAEEFYNNRIVDLQNEIAKPRANKLKNEERYASIVKLRHKLAELSTIMPQIGLAA